MSNLTSSANNIDVSLITQLLVIQMSRLIDIPVDKRSDETRYISMKPTAMVLAAYKLNIPCLWHLLAYNGPNFRDLWT
jgi:hypothetical protein